jgi:hypothetical protein
MSYGNSLRHHTNEAVMIMIFFLDIYSVGPTFFVRVHYSVPASHTGPGNDLQDREQGGS